MYSKKVIMLINIFMKLGDYQDMLGASLVAQTVKHLPATWETRVRFLGREGPLEKEMAIHSSTPAWKIPWMEEPDRLQSMVTKSQTRLSYQLLATKICMSSENEEITENACVCGLESGYGEGKINFEKLKSLI